jgi:hypothetical protein
MSRLKNVSVDDSAAGSAVRSADRTCVGREPAMVVPGLDECAPRQDGDQRERLGSHGDRIMLKQDAAAG